MVCWWCVSRTTPQVISQSLFIPVWIAFYSEDQYCNYLWVHGVNPVTLPVMGAVLSFGWLAFFVLTNYFFIVRTSCCACSTDLVQWVLVCMHTAHMSVMLHVVSMLPVVVSACMWHLQWSTAAEVSMLRCPD